MNFNQLEVKEYLKEAIQNLNFKKMTLIQEKVIPLILNKVSVVGQSQTGSGKTHAFLIPLLHLLDEDRQEVQIVITSPTRELAEQIHMFLLDLIKFSPKEISVKLFTGGTDRSKELKYLENNQPQIVIGTPGKIKDLAIKENLLKVFTTKYLVIDEADMTLENGFIEDIDNFAQTMNKGLNMFVFSATIPEMLKPFLKRYMENPEIIHINPKELSALNIKHYLMHTKYKEKDKLVVNILKTMNPFIALIFTNTKTKAEELSNYLTSNGFKIGLVHGDLDARKRKRVMTRIRNLEFQYIVATDIAARGIDIPGVSHVINYELPKDVEFYVHRSGRTARADLDGIVISLYDLEDDRYLDKLENKGIKFEFVTIKNNELIEAKERRQRANRTNVNQEITDIAKKRIKSSNKVKPNYKKKYNEKLKREKEKIRRKNRR